MCVTHADGSRFGRALLALGAAVAGGALFGAVGDCVLSRARLTPKRVWMVRRGRTGPGTLSHWCCCMGVPVGLVVALGASIVLSLFFFLLSKEALRRPISLLDFEKKRDWRMRADKPTDDPVPNIERKECAKKKEKR